jgi:hypothetical protein
MLTEFLRDKESAPLQELIRETNEKLQGSGSTAETERWALLLQYWRDGLPSIQFSVSELEATRPITAALVERREFHPIALESIDTELRNPERQRI